MEIHETKQERKEEGCLEKLRERIVELKQSSQDPHFTEYLMYLQDKVIKEKHTIDLLSDELERKYVLYQERMAKKDEPEQEAAPFEGGLPAGEIVSPKPPLVHTVVSAKPKKNSEFTFGIIAFSIVGVFFLLAAFVMLGTYFMTDFVKGMSLYVIAIAVLLFSRLVIRRRSDKLHMVLSILGIAGIHVSSYVNTYEMYNINYVVAGCITVLATILAIAFDKKRRKAEWKLDGISAGAYYSFAIAMYVFYVMNTTNQWCETITLIVLLLLTKLVTTNKWLYPLDCILSVIAVIFSIADAGDPQGYAVLAALLVSVLLIRYWHLFYQCLITGTTVLFILITWDSEIVITLVIAILWLAMLLFNHVERLRGPHIMAYNYTVVSVQAICYLALMGADYEGYEILYFILTFLGVGILYFMCQKKYGFPEAMRGLVMAVFLSYMAMVTDFTYPITSSILLMVIGFASIGFGFYQSDKKMRIYGLVLSLLVCFKITLFDFSDVEKLQQMILFFVAGIVALLISGIYILLEKKYRND